MVNVLSLLKAIVSQIFVKRIERSYLAFSRPSFFLKFLGSRSVVKILFVF